MSWNYRVVVENNEYTIREVYYDIPETDGMLWSQPMAPYGEDKAELFADLVRMLQALAKPVITVVEGKLVEVDGEETS